MGIKFSNNASANIIQALTSTATSVSVTTGKGALFPSITEGDYFYATLAGNNGLEIVKVTNRVNDIMTIVRAQDNTTALSFDTGDLFELRIVAADFNDTFSEVNNKLEASIEETTSIVNSAVSSKAPILHASSSTEYGAGSSEQYGHLKSHDLPDSTKTADTGHAFSPAGAAVLEGRIGDLASVVEGNAVVQSTRDAEQDAAISAKIATVNGLPPDSNGNVDVGGMPLGTLIPYTGKDVPAGTLRADGTTYTNMRSSFPEFYEWVVNSGLTVPLGSYALVEGSCGYYGLDASTGTVRMPTLAAGVFGTVEAGTYGQAVQAGLPDYQGMFTYLYPGEGVWEGAFYNQDGGQGIGYLAASGKAIYSFSMGMSGAKYNPIYGRSDTVTPSHVKFPWVIVVYNAAVPPSVAQAGEFVGLLDKLATALPAGTVVSHAGNKDLNGYLLCNGAAVSRTTYAKLYEAIGTIYGTGDGSTTFNLPDLTDRFIQGSGTAGTTKAAGLPNITGGIGGGIYTARNSWGAGYHANSNLPYESGTFKGTGAESIYFDASRSNSTYGSSTTVQPPALTMRYYIKY